MLGDKLKNNGFYAGSIAAIAIVLIASAGYLALNLHSGNEFAEIDSAYSLLAKWQNVRDMFDQAVTNAAIDKVTASCTAGQITSADLGYDEILNNTFGKICSYSALGVSGTPENPEVSMTITCENSNYKITKTILFSKTITVTGTSPNCIVIVKDAASGYTEYDNTPSP